MHSLERGLTQRNWDQSIKVGRVGRTVTAFASLPSSDDVTRFLPVDVDEPVQPQPTLGRECGEMQIELADDGTVG